MVLFNGHTLQLLVMFETFGHPLYSLSRSRSALAILDNLITGMGLLDMDRANPLACRFTQHSVPSVFAAHGGPTNVDSVAPTRCQCDRLSTCAREIAGGSTKSRRTSLAWPTLESSAETRREEQRRLVWSALKLGTGHMSYFLAVGLKSVDWNICRPWKARC